MLAIILKWLTGTGGLASALTEAYRARLNAQNDADRVAADIAIKGMETQLAVVREGMQHKAFWIPWLIAAVPTSAWFGWGMADSLFNGALPDVAALPPQLLKYADVVFGNIFVTGAGAMGVQTLASAIRSKT